MVMQLHLPAISKVTGFNMVQHGLTSCGTKGGFVSAFCGSSPASCASGCVYSAYKAAEMLRSHFGKCAPWCTLMLHDLGTSPMHWMQTARGLVVGQRFSQDDSGIHNQPQLPKFADLHSCFSAESVADSRKATEMNITITEFNKC